jgi:hypothetical protein
MVIQDLEKKIAAFSVENNYQSHEIINELISYLDSNFMLKDQSVSNETEFDLLKMKLISSLYSFPNHKTNLINQVQFQDSFNLRNFEMDLLEDALTELENNGDIYFLGNEIGLLEQGELKYQEVSNKYAYTEA